MLNRYLGTTDGGTNKLVGRLNVYTMETGDGRDIELTVVDECICWRRVNDANWKELVPLKELQQSRIHTEIVTLYSGDTMKSIVLPEGTQLGQILSMVATEKFTGECLVIDWRFDESTSTVQASILDPYDQDILLKVTYFDETS